MARETDGLGWWLTETARVASEFYSGRGFEWVVDHVPEAQVNALYAWSMLNGPWGGLKVRSGYVAQELARLKETEVAR